MSRPGERWLVVGRIVAAFGIRGEVRVRSSTGQLDRLLNADCWHIGTAEQDRVPVKLVSGRMQGAGLIVSVEGVVNRNQAEALVGQSLWLPRSQLPELTDEDEFYWCDLIGCQVQTEEGLPLGRVVEMMATGANDVLVVHNEEGVERLLPMTAEVVRQVDLDGRVLRVWLMPGL
ncbi:MAG: 16S rRNA processing protein RimM [Magnetococcales bacterium]|nr:16S rRNA processing protein RimM [Magnetococcales bacterium]